MSFLCFSGLESQVPKLPCQIFSMMIHYLYMVFFTWTGKILWSLDHHNITFVVHRYNKHNFSNGGISHFKKSPNSFWLETMFRQDLPCCGLWRPCSIQRHPISDLPLQSRLFWNVSPARFWGGDSGVFPSSLDHVGCYGACKWVSVQTCLPVAIISSFSGLVVFFDLLVTLIAVTLAHRKRFLFRIVL